MPRTTTSRRALHRYRAQLFFWGAAVLSVLTIGLLMLRHPLLFVPLVLSLGFNVYVLIRNERSGFVRTRQMRRAHEPARHFNALQVFAVVGLVMAQALAAAFVLLTG